MRILIINVPHLSIGSRIPREHLPPLGLLAIGGPLIDGGHKVRLIDAELGPMSVKSIVEQTISFKPEAILFGHSGSTSAQPIISEVTRAISEVLPSVWIILGGVYPTYHWRDILRDEPQIDFIVCGEGEETVQNLIAGLESNIPLHEISGIAYNNNDVPHKTNPTPLIYDLDAYRIGWELINPKLYSYWGNRRAVVAQFSRGCHHSCNYCGQTRFWQRWRHRDPKKFAAELAWLYRNHGIEVINFADENPTSSKTAWREFLEALIEENVPLTLVCSTRADNIVRDADILHLYKKAGVIRFLLGIESCDEDTLYKIRKEGTTAKDREAIRLLRENNIISMVTYIVGFVDDTARDYLRGLRQLISYDPDQIQMLFLTPHRWTPYYNMVAERQVIQPDLRKWDYKHQVLGTINMKPWIVFLFVKFIEAVVQLRPKSIWRVLTQKDKEIRHGMRWYYKIGRKVWFYELWKFFFSDKRYKNGPLLKEFLGKQEDIVNLYPNRKLKDCIADYKNSKVQF